MSKTKRWVYYILTALLSVNLLYFAGMFFTHSVRMSGNFDAFPVGLIKVLKYLYLEEFSMTFWFIAGSFTVISAVLIFLIYRKAIPKSKLCLPIIASAVVLLLFVIGVFLGELSYKISVAFTTAILLCTVFCATGSLAGILKNSKI